MKILLATAIFICAIFIHTSASDSLNNSLEGRTIILDPGHGLGADNVFEGYSEQARMLMLAQKIQQELLNRGATVHMVRDTPENVLLASRAAMINRWSLLALREYKTETRAPLHQITEIDSLIALTNRIIYNPREYGPIYLNMPFDNTLTRRIHPTWERIFQLQNHHLIRDNFLVISLHSNAAGNRSTHGADVFMSTNTNPRNMHYFAQYAHVNNVYIFADILLDNIQTVGLARRRIIPHHFVVIRENNLPSVLVENGFHTNAHDRSRLQSNDFLRRLAHAYAISIERYFSIVAPSPHLPRAPLPGPTLTLRIPTYEEMAEAAAREAELEEIEQVLLDEDELG